MNKEYVVELVRQVYPDANVTFSDVPKNNGVIRYGVTIDHGKNGLAPIYYYDPDSDLTDEELVEKLLEFYSAQHPIINTSEVFSEDYILSNVYPVVLNADRNWEYAENNNYYHKKILDLMVLFEVRIMLDDETQGSFKISEAMLEVLPISAEDVCLNAWKNLENDVLLKTPPEDMSIFPMLMLSNKSFYHGAATMFLPSIAKTFSNYYVIPSSIHEILLIPGEICSVEDIRRIIKDVNESVVSAEDFLSDNLYFIENSQIRIA